MAAAQKALWESEAKFRAEAGVGICVVDADGVLLDANPALLRMADMEREELIGESIRSLTVPEDLDVSLEAFGELTSDKREVNRLEKRHRRKNGEHFTASIVSTVVRDEAGAFMFGVAVVEDITERKRTEAALRESEERFRALVDNLPAGVTLKDGAGRLLLTNRTFEDWYDLQRIDLLGKRVEEVRPDLDMDPTVAAQRAIMAG